MRLQKGNVKPKPNPMNPERVQEMVRWLQMQIDHAKEVINESRKEGNFGREAQYEGVREAYMQCLSQITFL